MDVEKIKLLTTLKAGKNTWDKGTVFDRKDGTFPIAITEEIRAHLSKKSFGVIEILMTSADVEAEKRAVRNADQARADAEAKHKELEEAAILREQEYQATLLKAKDLQSLLDTLKVEYQDVLDEKETWVETLEGVKQDRGDLAALKKGLEDNLKKLEAENKKLVADNKKWKSDLATAKKGK